MKSPKVIYSARSASYFYYYFYLLVFLASFLFSFSKLGGHLANAEPVKNSLKTIEIKIAAKVNNEVITNQDIIEHQSLIEFLSGQKISAKASLDDLIRQILYKEQAEKLGEKIPEEELEKHLAVFANIQLPAQITISNISNYIKGELLVRKVVEKQIIPLINITATQVEEAKKQGPSKYKLEQIIIPAEANSQEADRTNLGWLEGTALAENIFQAIKNLNIGESSKIISLSNNKRIQFQLLDKENAAILAAKASIKIISLLDGKDLAESSYKTSEILNLALNDLSNKERKQLINLKPSQQSEISLNGQRYKIELISNNLEDIIRAKLYEKQIIEKEQDLQKELYNNAVVNIA